MLSREMSCCWLDWLLWAWSCSRKCGFLECLLGVGLGWLGAHGLVLRGTPLLLIYLQWSEIKIDV